MFPLLWLLVAWLILMALFGILTLITVSLNFRYAPAGMTTYVTTLVFLLVVVGVFVLTIPYLVTVDWSQSINLFGDLGPRI
ncbi:hypothetical protein FJZ48_03650 [Candidatus Uhrbacteria bacterium]|nr:hypothetical protein [Candidatus Uhrbacteria bacterium]